MNSSATPARTLAVALLHEYNLLDLDEATSDLHHMGY